MSTFCQFVRDGETIKCPICGWAKLFDGDPAKYWRQCGPDPVAFGQSGCCGGQAANMVAQVIGSIRRWAKSGFAMASKEVVKERTAICKGCDKLKGLRCDECGCVIAAKVRLATEKCPLAKW
jgi:hypothetical protein